MLWLERREVPIAHCGHTVVSIRHCGQKMVKAREAWCPVCSPRRPKELDATEQLNNNKKRRCTHNRFSSWTLSVSAGQISDQEIVFLEVSLALLHISYLFSWFAGPQ